MYVSEKKLGFRSTKPEHVDAVKIFTTKKSALSQDVWILNIKLNAIMPEN